MVLVSTGSWWLSCLSKAWSVVRLVQWHWFCWYWSYQSRMLWGFLPTYLYSMLLELRVLFLEFCRTCIDFTFQRDSYLRSFCSQVHFVEMDPWVVSNVLQPNLECTGFLDVSVIHTVRVESFLERAEQFVGVFPLSYFPSFFLLFLFHNMNKIKFFSSWTGHPTKLPSFFWCLAQNSAHGVHFKSSFLLSHCLHAKRIYYSLHK